jgi:hypothetical protein
MNKDGQLDQHGFEASMMQMMQGMADFGINKDEMMAIFKLSAIGRMFKYADFMAEIDENCHAVVKQTIPTFTMTESMALDQSIGATTDFLG